MKGKILLFLVVLISLGFSNCTARSGTGDFCEDNSDCLVGFTCYNERCVYSSDPCIDVDGGIFPKIMSIAYTEDEICSDYCNNAGMVKEYYCSGPDLLFTYVECPYWEGYSTYEGQCIPSLCNDSDGGQNIEVFGTTVDYKKHKYEDECGSTKQITEAYCDKFGVAQYIYLSCSADEICVDGQCVENKTITVVGKMEQDPECDGPMCGTHCAGETWSIDECNTCTCHSNGGLSCTAFTCTEENQTQDQETEPAEEQIPEPELNQSQNTSSNITIVLEDQIQEEQEQQEFDLTLYLGLGIVAVVVLFIIYKFIFKK